jgi:TonB family protein
MGKIVKFCTKCEESFAERFVFCPTCGGTLQKFEMKPISQAIAEEETPTLKREIRSVEPIAPAFIEPTPLITKPLVAAIPEPILAAVPEPVVEAAPVTKVEARLEPAFTAPARTPKAAPPVYTPAKAINVDRKPVTHASTYNHAADDGGFYVTVIEEKNVGTRNSLLLGTLVFMIFALLTGVVYSIFSKDLDIGAIDSGDMFNAVITELEPMTVEQEEQKKNDKKSGGGGGSGNEEKDPASKGDLADQSKTPTRPPNVNTMKSDTPMLETPTTEGTKTFPKIYGKWGLPDGADGSSNGPGTGGGIGSGRGTGQGNGNGTGAGNGNGSGFGNGDGNGNGNGTGPGDGDGPPPPPKGVSQALKITSKPKPSYTDAARNNQVTGTVILRVTFLASGQIGAISTVKGLPNGLTEQAIAAARSMRFEPAKVNGVGQNVTRQVEFSFSIY